MDTDWRYGISRVRLFTIKRVWLGLDAPNPNHELLRIILERLPLANLTSLFRGYERKDEYEE